MAGTEGEQVVQYVVPTVITPSPDTEARTTTAVTPLEDEEVAGLVSFFPTAEDTHSWRAVDSPLASAPSQHHCCNPREFQAQPSSSPCSRVPGTPPPTAARPSPPPAGTPPPARPARGAPHPGLCCPSGPCRSAWHGPPPPSLAPARGRQVSACGRQVSACGRQDGMHDGGYGQRVTSLSLTCCTASVLYNG